MPRADPIATAALTVHPTHARDHRYVGSSLSHLRNNISINSSCSQCVATSPPTTFSAPQSLVDTVVHSTLIPSLTLFYPPPVRCTSGARRGWRRPGAAAAFRAGATVLPAATATREPPLVTRRSQSRSLKSRLRTARNGSATSILSRGSFRYISIGAALHLPFLSPPPSTFRLPLCRVLARRGAQAVR